MCGRLSVCLQDIKSESTASSIPNTFVLLLFERCATGRPHNLRSKAGVAIVSDYEHPEGKHTVKNVAI